MTALERQHAESCPWRLQAATRSLEGWLYFNFQADFDDLGGRYPEVCGRKIGIKVHCGKQGLSPGRHASSHAAWDHHYPPEIVGDIPRIDAAQLRHEARKPQSLHYVWRLHKAEVKYQPRNPGANRFPA